MLPNQTPNLPVPQGAPSPMGAQGGGEEQLNPEQLKSLLIEVLGRVKAMAESNGIDFASLLGSVSGESPAGAGTPLPSGVPAGAPAPMVGAGM